MLRNSLERKKVDFCRYYYFIADENGIKLQDINQKYYNCM